MERAFLAGYAGDEATTAAPDLPALLKLFLIEKAAYEVAYEARLRPDWLLLPAAGLARLAERLVPEIDDVAPDA